MTTHRRYIFQHPQPWTQGNYEQMRAVLQHAAESCWWYNEPELTGEPDQLTFSFTVSGRDQWWVHRRAMKLAVDVYYVGQLNETDVPVPLWEALEPHTNRGRYRVPQ